MRMLWLVLVLLLLGLAPAQAQTQCLVPANFPATPVVASAAQNTTGGFVLKASPGCLLALYVVNSSTAGNLMVFNSVTVPGDGAVTPGTASGNLVHCIPIAASSYQFINFAPLPPEWYSVGISFAFSTPATTCTTKTIGSTLFIHGLVQ